MIILEVLAKIQCNIKNNIYAFIHMIFSCFSDDFNKILLSQLRETFFLAVSKCKIRKMRIMTNNANIFAGFQLTVFKNKSTFVKKICTARTILMHSKRDTVYTIYLVITMETAQK